MAKEKNFENKIKKYLKNQGCYYLKIHGSALMPSGTPDILACYRGRFIGLEIKAEDGSPTDLQIYRIRQIRRAGGLAYIVYPSGVEFLKEIIENNKNIKKIELKK